MLENHTSDEEVLPEGYLLSNRYVLDTFLGSGGMGAVYLASDTLLEEKIVAIKILHREFARDSELTRRFLREVNMMHSVNHPNVVRTYDAGVDNGLFYFTMEYIEGLLLDKYLEEAGRDYNLLGRIIAQICKGLEAIHDQKIVHRDLKPGNILVSMSGFVKITDFGVARPVSSGNTAHREIMGSLDYIPPEVFLGQEITPASDFYSLGVILYGIVTGKFPFEAEDPMAIVWKHVHEEAVPARALAPDIPEWLDFLIIRLLQKDASTRPGDAREIIRYVREQIYNRDGKLLDSGMYQTPTDSIIQEFAHEEYSVFDTDNFELSLDPDSIDHEINFDLDSRDGLAAIDEETLPTELPEDLEGDGFEPEFQSACHHLIFDTLPTVDQIRKHEQEWEGKKRLRPEDVGSPREQLKETVESLRESELRRRRLVMQISGVVIALMLFLIFGVPTYLGQQREKERKAEIAKSISDLRKEYLSGNANRGAVSSGERRKLSTQKSSSRGKQKSIIDQIFGEPSKSKPSSFLRLKSLNQELSLKSGANSKETAKSIGGSEKKGFLDRFLKFFGLDKESRASRKKESNMAIAPTVWGSRASEVAPEAITVAQIERVDRKSRDEKFSVNKFSKQNPGISSIFEGLSSVFEKKIDPSKLNVPTSKEQRILAKKDKLRKEISNLEARIDAYSVPNDQSLARQEFDAEREVASMQSALDGLVENVLGQLERQGVWSSFMRDGKVKDVAVTAEKLSKVDPSVAQQYHKYKAVDIEYRQILDKIRSGSASAVEKKEGREIGAKLSREREKLRAFVQTRLANSLSEGYSDLMNSAYAANILREKQADMELKTRARRAEWSNVKLNGPSGKGALKQKRADLEKSLNQFEKKLSDEREQEIKMILSVERLGR